MTNPRLFQNTRLKLAAWYATSMGIVLSIMGSYIYVMANQSYWSAVHQELTSLTGALHDSLEPKLKKPGVIDPSVKKEVLVNLCLVNESCPAQSLHDRHTLGISQRSDYYLRFYDLAHKLIATAGQQPLGTDQEVVAHQSMLFNDAQGIHYHRLFVAITTMDGRPWGFLQVGRSIKEFDDRALDLQRKLLLVLPAITLLVGLLSWWLAGQAMQPIRYSYEKMQQFTADAAHELRTPLASILATVEAAQSPESIEEATEALDIIERQTGRLIQLAEDLLVLLQIESPAHPRPETCQINIVVAELVQSLSALTTAAGIHLSVINPTAEPISVSIANFQAHRLLTNLIMNALQHTAAGGHVTVRLTQTNSHAEIQIQDTGIGIAPADQAQIFDRFYRVNAARTRQLGGAGLGLSITKGIVDVHHGSIEVKSKIGEGSTFIIRLPISRLDSPKN
jgi:signal transduction histidine kinase